MAEEFVLEVEVAGRFEKLREGLSRELEAIQKQGITVPVQAGGGATTTAATGVSATAGAVTTLAPTVATPTANAAVQLAAARAAAVVPVRTPTVAAAQAASAAGLNLFGAGAVVSSANALSFDPAGWRGLDPGGWAAVNAREAAPAAPMEEISIPAAAAMASRGIASRPFRGRGGRGFYDAPTNTRILGLSLLGAHEVFRATRALGRAEFESSLAESEEESMNARVQGIRAATSGFFGSILSEVWEQSGIPGSPESRERELLLQSARSRGQRRTSDILFDTYKSRTLREARIRGGTSAQDLAEVRLQAGESARQIAAEQAELQRSLAAGHKDVDYEQTGATGTLVDRYVYEISDPGLRQAKRSEIKALQQKLTETDRTQSQAEERLSYLRVAHQAVLGGRFASARATAAGVSQQGQSRLQLLIDQTTERMAAQAERPEDVPALNQIHAMERAALETQIGRANQLANIQSSTIVQSAALRAANRPYEAGLEELRGRGNAAAFQSRNDPAAYQRALQESNARRQEYMTGFAREQAQGLNQAADSQLVTQKFIDRDVLGARIAGIAAQRNTALDVTDALPPWLRERVQGSINAGADKLANLVRRQEGDTLRSVGMNVESRRRVSEIIADDSRPWGERVVAAQAEGIADDAMQRSEVWRQRGVGYEKFRQDELDIGRNELRAAKQAFVRSFQPVEIESLSRVALSGTDIDRNLREYRAQEDRLKQGGDRGGAFGPPPADSNQGVGAENARKTDRTNELLDLILKALENGITAVAGP